MPKENDNVITLDFAEEMKNSYRDYAMSVIIARALPDVRDGLKPVQRRILYAMTELGLSPDKPHRKSARIVGDTMGKYHPHGDSSIYDALVHMSEDYSLSIPLVDGHGNFGSIDGDSAAAMRYTEARLSRGAMALLTGLDKGLVDFIPNFDESEKEPVVLPAMIPNLLINGTTGIAVGMATNLPPHNPGEVIDGVIAFMDHPDLPLEKLMGYIPGPDFPTGGSIINAADLRQIYETGEGKLRIRAKAEIENGEYGRKNIIITEIPFTAAGNKTKLVESIVTLMKEKVFDEIYDVRDESSKEGLRIVIEVKRDRNVDNLLNGLYKKTPLEDTYSVNFLAVKDQQPVTFSLKGVLTEFIRFQEELYGKEYRHLLERAEARQEIVQGLIRATDVIDLIVEILRGSSSVKQARLCLTHGEAEGIRFKSARSEKQAKTLDFTERQADAILAMPLSRLVGLEILKLHEEAGALAGNIQEYKLILSDRKELYRVIKARLREFRKQFARERRTELLNVENAAYVEELRVEDIYVLIDKFGYAKSLDTASYSRLTEETLREYPHSLCMKNTDRLCLFTAEGNMYQIKAMAIPKCRIKDKGTLVHNLCKVGKEEILLYTSSTALFEALLFFASAKGYVKLVSGVEFETNRSCISATKLEEGDSVCAVDMLSAAEVLAGNRKVILLTHKGLSLGFPLPQVGEMKKTGRGVKGIALDDGDTLAFAGVVAQEEEVFEANGKEYHAKKVRMRSRGAKGQKAVLN